MTMMGKSFHKERAYLLPVVLCVQVLPPGGGEVRCHGHSTGITAVVQIVPPHGGHFPGGGAVGLALHGLLRLQRHIGHVGGGLMNTGRGPQHVTMVTVRTVRIHRVICGVVFPIV